MSGFDVVVEYDEPAGTTTDSTDGTTDGSTMIETQVNVPDVGSVEEWLAQRNLTVSEAALLINTLSMLVIAISLAWEVRSR